MKDRLNSERWKQDVRELLDFLPRLYPGGEEWLEARLELVLAEKAFANSLRDNGGRLIGIVLGIPKSSERFKISTLYVAEGHRSKGVGGRLLDAAVEQALRLNCEQIYITGASIIRDQLYRLLASRGFVLTSTVADRYGPGRQEDVYSLSL